mgnify:CR=1 FL=1
MAWRGAGGPSGQWSGAQNADQHSATMSPQAVEGSGSEKALYQAPAVWGTDREGIGHDVGRELWDQ